MAGRVGSHQASRSPDSRHTGTTRYYRETVPNPHSSAARTPSSYPSYRSSRYLPPEIFGVDGTGQLPIQLAVPVLDAESHSPFVDPLANFLKHQPFPLIALPPIRRGRSFANRRRWERLSLTASLLHAPSQPDVWQLYCHPGESIC